VENVYKIKIKTAYFSKQYCKDMWVFYAFEFQDLNLTAR
jgi:hypothetical protein